MIVSHRHRFIFLKTKKTAGTSLEAALSQICGPDDIITPYREASEGDRRGRAPQNYRLSHPLVPKRPLWRRLLGRPERYYHESVGYYEHMPAWRIRAYLGEEIWSSYFKIAFDRNPWDRQISWYFYKTKSKSNPLSFDSFMQDKRRAYVDNFEIYSIDGVPVTDYLGRYEHLEQDFAEVLDKLEIKERVEVPQTNVNARRNRIKSYQDFYDDTTRGLVENWYAREISLLQYEFA